MMLAVFSVTRDAAHFDRLSVLLRNSFRFTRSGVLSLSKDAFTDANMTVRES
jgi:hypothetical protein